MLENLPLICQNSFSLLPTASTSISTYKPIVHFFFYLGVNQNRLWIYDILLSVFETLKQFILIFLVLN